MKRDNDDLHATIMERADDALESDFANREEALSDLQFRAGDQWDPDIKAEFEAEGRPCPTINLIPKFIRQVTNDARENKPAIKVRGVDDDSDPDTAKVLEGIIRNIEDQCEAASRAYIPAIDNAATCGIGNWRVKTQYAGEDPFGSQDIIIEGIPNALAVLYDPMAKEPDRSDARYVFILDELSEEEFEAKYPGKTASGFELGDFTQGWLDLADKTVRIAEYWCKEPVTKTFGRTQDGKSIDLTDIPAPSIKFLGIEELRKVKCHKIVQYIVSGAEILEGPTEFPGKYIPIVPVIGEEVHVGTERVRYGIVRFAKDSMRLYNYWRAAQAEQIAKQPKSPILATAKQIEPYKEIWGLANKRSFPYLPYVPDGSAPPPQRLQPAQGSVAMHEEALFASEEIKATTGIYDAALGNKSNETSGVAIQNRQRESDVSNLHFSDNMALAIRHTGRIIIGLIPEIYDTERVVRLLNEDGTEAWERINTLIHTENGPVYKHDLGVGKYDVTVKVGPSYQTRRQESADAMLQFIKTVPDSAQFILDLLAKNMDWPGSEEIAKRFRLMLMKTHPELVEKNAEEEQPPPSQADQMNALMGQLEARTKEADARKAEAEAEDAEMDAAVKGMQVAQVAAQGPIEIAAEQAVMNVLQRLLGQGQSQGQSPTQPGQGQGMPPAPSQPQFA